MIPLPKGVNATRVAGRPYFYYHPHRGTVAAGKPVRLPDDPNSREFWLAYCQLSGAPLPDEIGPPVVRVGTVDALIEVQGGAQISESRAGHPNPL
jgi:hypothetical protein